MTDRLPTGPANGVRLTADMIGKKTRKRFELLMGEKLPCCVLVKRPYQGTGVNYGGKIRTTNLSRCMAALRYGEVPAGMVAKHTCDNPRCINPYHIVVGTQGENMQEMVGRGRGGGRKLTGEARQLQREQKRQEYLDGKYNLAHLSDPARHPARKGVRGPDGREWPSAAAAGREVGLSKTRIHQLAATSTSGWTRVEHREVFAPNCPVEREGETLRIADELFTIGKWYEMGDSTIPLRDGRPKRLIGPGPRTTIIYQTQDGIRRQARKVMWARWIGLAPAPVGGE